MEIMDSIQQAFSNMVGTVGEKLPALISAIIMLLIFWIVARMIRWALTKVLRAVKFDNIADQVGINGYIAKAGLKSRASDWIAKLGYWIVMFTGLLAFFNKLNMPVVSNLLNDVIQFIPNIIIACILLIVGMYLAKFVQGLVTAALKTGGFTRPELVGNIAYGAIMFLAIALVLNQLQIGNGIIDKVVTSVVGGLGLGAALAFGLSFGLGNSERAKEMVDNLVGKK